jgi:small subunit ribosomal protein S8
MYITDPIGDMLTRVRNALQRQYQDVTVPSSKMLVGVAELLKQEGFINSFEVIDSVPQKQLRMELKYVNGQSAIRGLKRESKPGIRRYLGYRELPRVKNGFGIAILSTPKGLMTDKMARAAKVGGEFLCSIW